MKRVLWWIFAGTRGGPTRARIVLELRDHPSNANQLAEKLGLDYKTVRHHLSILMDNKILVQEGEGYGGVYFLSDAMEKNFHLFDEIWGRIGKMHK